MAKGTDNRMPRRRRALRVRQTLPGLPRCASAARLLTGGLRV